MFRIFMLSVAVCFTAFCQAQDYHVPVLTGIAGTTLQSELKTQYKPIIHLDYGDARDSLFGRVDRQGETLSCIYSGHTVDMPFGADPTTAVYLGGSNDGINTEHVYPQSLWSGGNSPKSDMHHLFPTKANINNDRGSFPFAEIADNQTERWYYMSTTTTSIPSSNIDAYSEYRNGSFEPREDVKGDIARCMFYFYTMYRSEADAVNPTWFNNQLPTLLYWHELDPVDTKEWNRTWKIALHQSGKPNPFVLDCSLAERAYGGSPGANCNLVPVEETLNHERIVIKVFPNPASVLNIEVQGDCGAEFEWRIFNIRGELLLKGQDVGSVSPEVSDFTQGMYWVEVKMNCGNRTTLRRTKWIKLQ